VEYQGVVVAEESVTVGAKMYWLLITLILIPQIGSAECAWVLWLAKDHPYLHRIGEWSPNDVFDTKTECMEEMKKTYELFKAGESKDIKIVMDSIHSKKNRMKFRITNLIEPLKETVMKVECWPSGVKPN